MHLGNGSNGLEVKLPPQSLQDLCVLLLLDITVDEVLSLGHIALHGRLVHHQCECQAEVVLLARVYLLEVELFLLREILQGLGEIGDDEGVVEVDLVAGLCAVIALASFWHINFG